MATWLLGSIPGHVVSLSRSNDLSRGDRVLAANEAIHTGSILERIIDDSAAYSTFVLPQLAPCSRIYNVRRERAMHWIKTLSWDFTTGVFTGFATLNRGHTLRFSCGGGIQKYWP